jgi:hypothetical protein
MSGKDKEPILNRQFAKDLISGLDVPVTDESRLVELQGKFLDDELDPIQRGFINRALNAAAGRRRFETVDDIRRALESGRDIREFGPATRDFFSAILDEADHNRT